MFVGPFWRPGHWSQPPVRHSDSRGAKRSRSNCPLRPSPSRHGAMQQSGPSGCFLRPPGQTRRRQPARLGNRRSQVREQHLKQGNGAPSQQRRFGFAKQYSGAAIATPHQRPFASKTRRGGPICCCMLLSVTGVTPLRRVAHLDEVEGCVKSRPKHALCDGRKCPNRVSAAA